MNNLSGREHDVTSTLCRRPTTHHAQKKLMDVSCTVFFPWLQQSHLRKTTRSRKQVVIGY
ncbi:unnamed protein product [Musa acuminata var. zebrina]